MKKALIIAVALILVSNILSGFINLFTKGIIATYHYQSENAEFKFTVIPAKGRGVDMMEGHFTSFKASNPDYKDLKLYRTFNKNLIEFWNWYAFLTDAKYQYEYRDEIDLKPGKVTSGSYK
ncbi:hypothetical protein PBT90_04965 [Algoriphagus halophytocola]|uniref:Uncharacterized protein n=1 Tax=Algoriphagus halophytocola TaxID=2991499 RepID=A0ABY6MHT9_9BACT|nr:MULTISPECIES: hypothetical protein [unclassified Algoriphagus]UZD22768.1 hypothetical protein OM944_19225 [Algoriphagus sp. TR-M5]WBL44034.1 hypothetical protein PBT90_04965 [Algoriphagus sp. TR-M9]